MQQITMEHNPSPMKLEIMGVYEWAIWKHEIAIFDWTYDKDETCYFLTGEVIVTPENGEAVSLKKGILSLFQQG